MQKSNRLLLTLLSLWVGIFVLGCHPNLRTNESLDEAKKLHEKYSELSKQGRYLDAIPVAKHFLAIVEKAYGPDDASVATGLNDLAFLYTSLGEYAKAEPLYKHSLAILEKALGPGHPNVATSLNNLARLYIHLGNYSKAETLNQRALAIREKALGPEHPAVATSLNNLARLYIHLGNYSKAETLNQRALAIREKALGPEHPAVASSLLQLGYAYIYLGNYSKAEPLLQRALAIREKALGPEHPAVACAFIDLAILYLHSGKTDKAINIFKKQNSHQGLAFSYLGRNNYGEALKEFQESLKLEQKSGTKANIIGHNIGLGFSYEGLGQLEMAKRYYIKAIDLINEQWKTLGLAERKTFLGSKVSVFFYRLDAYEGIVRTIIKDRKKDYQKDSLSYVEAVKSRTLLQMLAAKGAKGVGTEDQEILATDRRFQQDITMLRKRLSIVANLGDNAPRGKIEDAEKKLKKTLQDYESFINEIKLGDTEVESLITLKATPVEKIQSLLDPNTTILEYFVTKDKTYVWLITRDRISVHELDLGKKKLLAMVNQLLLPNISNRSRKPEPLITVSTGESRSTETGKQQKKENRKRFLAATRDFYKSILGPIADGLDTDGLIIVPHGVLHKVPFAALNDGKKFLIDKYALSVVPSSSVLEYVVKKRKVNKGKFLAFANPKTDYFSLDYAEVEVDNISGLFSNKQIYSRKEATESKAKELTSSSNIIHFACHGEFNDKQPMQSGLLLAKDDKNDGDLQVHEIFGIDLRNTNLVVLSACETALSKIYSGDDLVGLSRGFIYAGTPSLLATLWEVEDHSTAILIEEFYKNWQKKGMSKPKALQQAQIALKSMPQYQHPFFWAPFIMIGDWR
jgi:CHAT domain-containing protein/Tfp pilus assembly protein PilF